MTPETAAPLFALCAAAAFGSAVQAQSRGVARVDAVAGALIGVAVATLVFAAAAPFVVRREWIATEATAVFALCGLFMPAFSMVLAIRGVKLAGPAITGSLGAFSPFFAAAPAVFLLGEPATLATLGGLLLMCGGLALAPFVRGAGAPRPPLWALTLPLGAAGLRGASQVLAKVGLTSVPSPVWAALVTFAVSTLVLALLAGRRAAAALVTTSAEMRRAVLWFAAAGALNGLGLLLLNFALSRGDVVVTAPLAATSPLWTLAFGAALSGGERPGLRHLGVALLVAAGAALVVSR